MKLFFRVFKILSVFAQYRLDDCLPATSAGKKWLSALLYCFPARWRSATTAPHTRLRLTCEALGPVFIKMGQMLSTRQDLLADDWAADLALLQDRVPPFPSEQAVKIIEREFNKPLNEIFYEFDRQPLASASVAQVHSAKLSPTEEVVVKVIRPDILPVIQCDLALIATGIRWLESWIPELRRLHLGRVVDDYKTTLLAELDLTHEASNTQQMRRNFTDSPLLYVPHVYDQWLTPQVMVIERIYGVPVSQVETLKHHGISLQQLAERGLEIFFTQVFHDNFFHADMHPGNVYVSVKDPQNPQYIALDCAIIGSLSKTEQLLLAKQLLALMQQDYELLAELLMQAGWVPTHIRPHEFALALRSVCQPLLDKPLDQIEFGPILARLFKTARAFEVQALPQFVLLEKTLLHVEGLGRQLYPQLDIWRIGRPLLERWIKAQIGPEALIKTLKRQLPFWLEQLPQIPQLAYDALQQVKTQRQLALQQSYELITMQHRLAQQQRKDSVSLILGVAALLAAMVAGQLADHAFLQYSELLGGVGLALITLRLLKR